MTCDINPKDVRLLLCWLFNYWFQNPPLSSTRQKTILESEMLESLAASAVIIIVPVIMMVNIHHLLCAGHNSNTSYRFTGNMISGARQRPPSCPRGLKQFPGGQSLPLCWLFDPNTSWLFNFNILVQVLASLGPGPASSHQKERAASTWQLH